MMYVEWYEKGILDKGRGVFTKKLIKKGALVWKLTESKIFTKDEYQNAPESVKKDAYPEGNHYVQAVGRGESWNHSCLANTWWTGDDKLSARRDIFPGEELTYDYATTDIDPNIVYTWGCRCGESNCRKILHFDDILKPEIYNMHKGHLPSWVEEFIKTQQNMR